MEKYAKSGGLSFDQSQIALLWRGKRLQYACAQAAVCDVEREVNS